jgi:hypothetical protein
MKSSTACGLSLVAVACSLGCASADAQFAEGQRAYTASSWQQATDAFSRFERENCPTTEADARCKEAHVNAGEALLRMGEPQKAFFELEAGKRFEPTQGPLTTRLEELQKKAQELVSSRQTRAPGQATLSVRFESRTGERFKFQTARFLLDLKPLPTENTPYVKDTLVRPVPSTPVSAGDHELEIVAVYEGAGHVSPDYRFTVRDNQAFKLKEGESMEIDVRISDKPGTTPLDALTMTFEGRLTPAPPPPPPAPPPSAPPQTTSVDATRPAAPAPPARAP